MDGSEGLVLSSEVGQPQGLVQIPTDGTDGLFRVRRSVPGPCDGHAFRDGDVIGFVA